MHGRAAAPGAGTVLNALATGTGSAFALDVETAATVELTPDGDAVVGAVADEPGADTTLIERCVTSTVAAHGHRSSTLADAGVDVAADATPTALPLGGTVRTESEVPLAAGLKSSSAAANATVLATLSALGLAEAVEPVDACRLGVRAARDAGVTVTGAFDDASASMLGGVTLTDNGADELLARDSPAAMWADDEGHGEDDAPSALVWTPPERAYSADADVDRCERVAPVARTVASLARQRRYVEAMTVNGFAFSAALGFDAGPAVEALPAAEGVSLSGTGPSVVAVGEESALSTVAEAWGDRPGAVLRTQVRATGATVTD
ncbi:MAG: shikimate kinase [Halolamina sp.]